MFGNLTVTSLDMENKVVTINVEHIGTITSTSVILRNNTVIANFTNKTIESHYNNWKFSGNVSFELTITIVPNQPQEPNESVYNWVKRHLEKNLAIGLTLTEPQAFGMLFEKHRIEIEGSNLNLNHQQEERLAAATTILVIILLAPVGA